MSIFSFSVAEIPNVLNALWGFIKNNPILSFVLIISYVPYFLYMLLYKSTDTDIYDIDLLSCGISSVVISIFLLGIEEDTKNFDISAIDLSSKTTKVAIILFVYAVLLIVFAFTKILPKLLVVLLGNSEIDFFINLMAILMVEPDFEITGTLIVVVAVPLLILLIFQRLRRMMG